MAARHSIEPTLVRFARHLHAQSGLAEITVQNYVSAIRRLEPLIGLKPTPKAIERHIERMRKSGASYSHIVNTSNGAHSILLVAKRFQRKRLQKRLLLGEHRRHLPLGSAVDALVSPVLFPVIQIWPPLGDRQGIHPPVLRLPSEKDGSVHHC